MYATTSSLAWFSFTPRRAPGNLVSTCWSKANADAWMAAGTGRPGSGFGPHHFLMGGSSGIVATVGHCTDAQPIASGCTKRKRRT